MNIARRGFLAAMAALLAWFGLRLPQRQVQHGLPDGVDEYVPETIDGAVFFPWCCDGCDGCKTHWHVQWYATGWRREDGRVYEVVYQIDDGGNWEFCDEKNVADADIDEWRQQFSYEESLKVQRAYAEWVRENRRDPLEYYVAHEWPEVVDELERYV